MACSATCAKENSLVSKAIRRAFQFTIVKPKPSIEPANKAEENTAMNQLELIKQENCLKRGKIQATTKRLIIVFNLIS